MKRLVLLVFAAILPLMITGCSKSAPARKGGTLTIVYTGNIGGLLDLCGCRNPIGGISRRATVIQSIKEENPDALVLDSGSILNDSSVLNTSLETVFRKRMHLLVEEIGNMGIDGANVSSMDLFSSADSLLAFQGNGLPWLSSNLTWRDSGKLVFPADTLRMVGELRVGIFGFMDDNTLGMEFFDEQSPLKILDPANTVREEVDKLQKQCDVIIALAYMDLNRVQKLVTEIPGIDVVIVSHTQSHTPSSDHKHFQPVKQGKTLLARCPDGGRVIGKLDLTISSSSTDFINTESQQDLRPLEVQQKEKRTYTQSYYTNTFIDLSRSIPENEDIQKKVEAFMKYWKEAAGEPETKE